MTSKRKKVLFIEGGAPDPKNLHRFYSDAKEWQVLRIDPDAALKPDFIGSLKDLSAVPDNHVDGVWFSHLLQKLTPAESKLVMVEISRILKPDGHFISAVTDAQLVIDHLANGNFLDELSLGDQRYNPNDILFGPQCNFRQFFTALSIGRLLQDAGFREVQVSREHLNLWIGGRWQPSVRTELFDKVRLIDYHRKHQGPQDDLAQPPVSWKPLGLGLKKIAS